MLAITLIALALRGYHSGFYHLWYDETFTAWTVAQSLRDILWISVQDVVHPPLYYILLSGWTRLVGSSEFALRATSVGLGVLGVPLLYQLGWRGWSRRVGIAAAFLWAFAPYVVWYAQDARMYALLTAVGLAAVLCLARALPSGSSKWLLANAVLNLVGLYTHYFYLFLILGQYLYLALSFRRHRHAFWRWFLVNGIAALLYLPWLVAILLRGIQRAQIAWVPALSLEIAWQTVWELVAGKERPVTVWAALGLVVLVTGLVTEALKGRLRRRSSVPGLQWTQLLTPLVLVALISLRRPLFHSKFLQISVPSFLLLASAGLFRLFRTRLAIILLGIVVLSWIPAFPAMYDTQARSGQDWKAAMEYLSASTEQKDVIAFRGGQGIHSYWYYYDGPEVDVLTLSPEETYQNLGDRAGGSGRIWLVIWDTVRSCEIPDQFVPGPGDSLRIIDTHCTPEVLIVAFSGQGQQQ